MCRARCAVQPEESIMKPGDDPRADKQKAGEPIPQVGESKPYPAPGGVGTGTEHEPKQPPPTPPTTPKP